MRKMIVIMFVFFLAFSITSCSKKPSDILLSAKTCAEKFDYEKGDNECIKAYYTKESAKKIMDSEKKSPDMKDKKKGKELADGSEEWEVVKEIIKGDSARVTIKIVKSPREKVIGSVMTYHLEKEDGEWKVNIVATIQGALQRVKAIKTKAGVGGMKNMKKSDKLKKNN